MKSTYAAAFAAASLTLGFGIGYAARVKPPGMSIMAGKPAKDAGIAALQEAEVLAEDSTRQLAAIARIYYLSGDKAKGQQLINRVLAGDADGGDWQRVGQIYADAGENDKAAQFYDRTIAADGKDDSAHAEIGGWYIRIGQREKGEALLAKALARNPDEAWHYVHAAAGYLGVMAR
jgi:tetratricopeptide (TPR) repeat protein